MAKAIPPLEQLNRRIVACEKCPRLRAYCAQVAQTKRAAFRAWNYYGKPVPNFGDPAARLLLVGLAPAAHGANRTGRMFTGDRSGDFLYPAMFETGWASQPTATHAGDGLELQGALITAAAHCAPPDNKPLPAELANCSLWLEQTFDLLPDLRVVLCLGGIAFDRVVRLYRERGYLEAGTRPRFAHGALLQPPHGPALLACYHPSQQNTFTGRLTPAMLRQVFAQARQLCS